MHDLRRLSACLLLASMGILLRERAALAKEKISADFISDVSTGCPPLPVRFTDRSSGLIITAWVWDFGDGSASSEQNPSHVYEQPGEYTVTLTVENGLESDAKTKAGFIVVKEKPRAAFELAETTGCAPFEVKFSDLSTGTGLSLWSWDFGDGGTSQEQSPTHAYTEPGLYSVRLTVHADCGEDTAARQGLITVREGVTAEFAAEPTSGCAPLQVAFTDGSRGDGLNNWRWEFGDGATSSLRGPTHTFGSPGTYTVTLRVSGECGDATETKEELITVLGGVAADFRASARSGCPPLTVTFTDTSHGDSISGWIWDFGDGSTSTQQNPQHTYKQAGNFNVKLTTTGACAEDSVTKNGFIRVGAIPAAPASVKYADSAFLGDAVTVTWPEAEGAATYVLEESVNNPSSWSPSCEVEDDPSLRNYSCTRTLDEIGTWRFRVRAVNSCGESDSTTGAELEVLPPAVFADWPLDGCVATDVENGNDGRFNGAVSCASNRFANDRSSLLFRGTGFVEGGDLPPWDGEFTVSFWFLPDADASASSAATLFEIRPGDTSGARRLRLAWDDRDQSMAVTHGDAAPLVVERLSRTWHHVAVARLGDTATVFVDGQSEGTFRDTASLGEAFAIGGSNDQGSVFQGRIDDVLYESRARGSGEVLDGLLAANGMANLVPTSLPDVSLQPGGRAEALRLELRTGQPFQGDAFELRTLALRLEQVDPEPSGNLDSVPGATLFLRSRCDGDEVQLTEVGKLERVSSTAGAARLELRSGGHGPIVLPAGAPTCFTVELEIGPRALPENISLRLVLESLDDLQLLAGGRRAFVAGRSREDEPALTGAVVHVLNDPPRLALAVNTAAGTIQEKSPVEKAELHELMIQAGPTENIRVDHVIYRPLEDTRVDGITNAQLLLDDGAGPKKVADGVVDEDAQAIRFEGLPVEVSASSSVRLILQANLKAVKPPAPAEASTLPAAPRAPAVPGRVLAELAILAAAGLAILCFTVLCHAARGRDVLPRLRLRTVLRPAGAWILAVGALTLSGCGPLIIGAGVAIGVIATGGGSGGGSGGSPFSTSFQVGIHSESDLGAKGSTTDAPALIDLGGADILEGPLFEVEKK
jgi:PKD repeat protein